MSVEAASVGATHRAAARLGLPATFSLHHVGVAVEDIAASRKLYAEALGFDQVRESVEVPSQGVLTCFIDAGGIYVELVQALRQDSPLGRKRGPYHLCFSVPDLDEAVSVLRERSFVPISRFTQAAMQMERWAYLIAPDGLLLELGEPTKGVT